jgi:acetolactate synthase-1/2/3 large subunit
MTTVSQYINKRLEKEVDHAFCSVGGAAIFLTDALKDTKIKPIFLLHEQASAIAAEAYGQYTNKLGVCICTAGPGVLNVITPITAAFIDSTPMIILSGQANTNHLSDSQTRSIGIQEVKTAEIVKPITKAAFTIKCPQDVPNIIEKAILLAKSGRPGPVLISIPLNMQTCEIDNIDIDWDVVDELDQPLMNWNMSTVQSIIKRLQQAKKPAIFVGNGVRLSDNSCYQDGLTAISLLKSALEKLRIPILTTWRAMDLFTEDHPLYIGRPGMVGERGANTTLQTCDFLLCLGTRLDLPSVAFDYSNFAPNAEKVIVDVDQAELDKLAFEKTEVHEDAWIFLDKLNLYINNNNITYENNEWLQLCKELHKQPISTIHADINSTTLCLYELIEWITPYLKDKVIAVGSSGSISECFCQSFKVQEGCRIIQSNGLGSMGFGLPAAIGAHYASGKPVICLDGDGSMALNIQELQYINDNNLPIYIIIINNGGYVSIKNTQDNLCQGDRCGVDRGTGLSIPNYEKIANAHNIHYDSFNPTMIGSGQVWKLYIEGYMDKILAHNRPHILEVFTDPNHKTQCRTTTTKQPDGSMKASGLENLCQ